MALLSSQIIDSLEGHTRVLAAIFTQHSEPFKHDAAGWARPFTRDELQPFFEINAKRIADEPVEVGTEGELFASAQSGPAASPPKSFLKEITRLCGGEGLG
jgi:hypothetical protein